MAAYFFDSSALAKLYHPEIGTPVVDRIVGTAGKLLIPHPWLPQAWPAELYLTRQGKTEIVRVDTPKSMEHALAPFTLELKHFCHCVREGCAPQFPPDIDAERDSRANIRVLDALAKSARAGRAVAVMA